MPKVPHIELRAVLVERFHDGRPDYRVMANGSLVGRIYLTMNPGDRPWFWGLNAVLIDLSYGGAIPRQRRDLR